MADGICFRDRKWGLWTGSFVDASHDMAIKECYRLAHKLSGAPLPADGDIVAVNLVVDEDATIEIMGSMTESPRSHIETIAESLE